MQIDRRPLSSGANGSVHFFCFVIFGLARRNRDGKEKVPSPRPFLAGYRAKDGFPGLLADINGPKPISAIGLEELRAMREFARSLRGRVACELSVTDSVS